MIVQGDEISVGNGVAADEIRFIVQIPRSARSMTTNGIHAIYDIGAVVGQGAFAVVRKAIERVSGKNYAIKIIRKNKISNNVAVQREIEILKQLDHAYVVGLKDFYEDSTSYYLVMDYVGGGDLMDFVISNGPIAEDASREIVRQVLVGVGYVHGLGISHRDLKPDNILISQDDPVIVKVSDFGLAKISQSGSFLKTFCGTLAYLAPEVMSGKNRGPQHTALAARYSNLVDIWSIGCLAYVILTGYLPFDGSTQEHLYANVLNGRFLMGPLKDKGISESGISFISSLLQVDPLKRPSALEALNLPWIKEGESQRPVESAEGIEVGNLHVSNLQIHSSKEDNNVESHESDSDSGDAKTPFTTNEEKEQNGQADSVNSYSASQGVFSGIRDLDVEEADIPLEEVLDDETWMKLQTVAESIPFQDMYISKDRISIGRKNDIMDMDVTIADSRISKFHCELVVKNGLEGRRQLWLIDRSTNGCLVNGIAVGKGKKALLGNGDILYLFLDFVASQKQLLGFEVKILQPDKFESRSGDLEAISADEKDMDISRSVSTLIPAPKKRAFGTIQNGGSVSSDNTEEPPRKLVSIHRSRKDD